MTSYYTPSNNSGEFTILLVDDDTQINDLLTQTAKNDFPEAKFIHITNYTDALTYLESITGWGPRLILLDVDLKENKTGLDLLTWIRKHEKHCLIPVIMLSVVHEEDIVRDAYARGANSFTNKPFAYEEWKAYVQYLRTYWFTMASTPKIWFNQGQAS